MEQWQKEHITKNLEALIELTSCDQNLLASLQVSNILGRADVENLSTVRVSQGNLAQSSRLYEIVQTRLQGYENMARVLFQCKQSGAFMILLNGFREHGIKNPLDHCQIAVDGNEIISTTVNFQGRDCKITDILPNITQVQLLELMKHETCQYSYIDHFINGGESKFVLAADTIPPPPPLYINRSITNRFRLNPRIFKEECDDVFVFKGVERNLLSKLVYPHGTSPSSVEILELTSRFILLEDEVDWMDLQRRSRENKCPIHLVKVESRDENGNERPEPEYVLEGTVGTLSFLWRYVERQTDRGLVYISEDAFLEKMDAEEDYRGFCICDTPGMGKSWLLASIARKIRDRHPNRLVAFLPAAEFIKTVKSKYGVDQLDDVAVSLVVSEISTSPFSKVMLQNSVTRNSLKLDVFLDGLDEVASEDFEYAKAFLEALAKSNHGNITSYVTSRPQLRRELESVMGVIAYDIMPFTDADQEKFLVQSWEHDSNSGCNASRLETFAKACLSNLKSTLTDQERAITGIPLQCYLLAQVFQRQAVLYADRHRKQEIPHLKATSVHEMYKTFLNEKLTSIEMKQYHVWKALQLLYPGMAAEYAKHNQVSQISPTSIHWSLGVLQGRSCGNSISTEFVHRTFAEFLVSEYFAETLTSDILSGNAQLEEMVSFFIVDKVLRAGRKFNIPLSLNGGHFSGFKFLDEVLAYFINSQVANCSSDRVNDVIARHLMSNISVSRFHEILQCIISQNCTNLLKYLKHALETLEWDILQPYRSYLLESSVDVSTDGEDRTDPATLLLCVAAHFSNLPILLECFQLFRQQFRCDLTKICESMSDFLITPLHWALKRAHYELVEYLVDKISLDDRELLYWAVDNSYDEPAAVINKRLEICKLLIGKNAKLLDEVGWVDGPSGSERCSGPLVANKMHLKLLKLLIQRSPVLYVTRQRNNKSLTFVHLAKLYMSSEDYQELSRFLIEDCQRGDLLEESSTKRWSRLDNFITDERDMRRNLKAFGIPVNQIEEKRDYLEFAGSEDDNTSSLLQELLTHGYPTSMQHLKKIQDPVPTTTTTTTAITDRANLFMALVDGGLDVFQKGITGHSLVHRVATCFNFQEYHVITQYLIGKGLGHVFHAVCDDGTTPLDTAIGYLELFPETIDILVECNVDLNADQGGTTILHTAVDAKRSLKLVKHLVSLGANVHARDQHNRSVVHFAASAGLLDHLKYFVDQGCDVNLVDNNGHTALHSVAEDNPENACEVVKYLLTTGLDASLVNVEGMTAFMLAKEQGVRDGKLMDLLYPHANLFKGSGSHVTGVEFQRLLHQYEVMFPNMSPNQTMNVLATLKGTQMGGVDTVKSLIEAGYDICDRDEGGYTSLHRLTVSEQFSPEEYHEIAECLVRKGVGKAFGIPCNLGVTPIHMAMHEFDMLPATVTLLQSHHLVDLNSKAVDGSTVLTAALTGNRNLSLIKHLVSLGADVGTTDDNNNSLIQHSARLGKVEHFRYFLEQGCDVNHLDNDGDNALQCVIGNGKENIHKIVQILVASGVDTKHVNKNGKTAFQIANEKGVKDKGILSLLGPDKV